MKQPLVSIVITCYNYAEYVGAAIDSVISQTYENIELIIIDDGSTDNSLEVIKKYADNAQIVSRENKGIVYTRNEGVSLASGDFICFLDADDFFDKDYIEKMVRVATDNNADIVYPNWHVFGDNEYHTSFKEFDLQLLIRQEIHCTVESLIRAKAIEGHYFESEKVAEDWDFFLGLALAGKKFKLAKDCFINYRVRKNTRGNSRPFWDDMYEFCEILTKWQSKYPDKVNPFDLPILVGKRKDERIKELEKLEDVIKKYEKELNNLRESLSSLTRSHSFRIGRAVLAPLRFAKRLLR